MELSAEIFLTVFDERWEMSHFSIWPERANLSLGFFMIMINPKVHQIFTEISEMLEVLGENPFRVRAYQRAAEVVRGMGKDVEDIFQENPVSLKEIPGIGPDLHAKIIEIITTGKCTMHEELFKKVGQGVLDILRVRGVGPKKVKLFMEQLDIHSVEQLRAAAESGALAVLPGMGQKSQAAIVEALNQATYLNKRFPYAEALKEAKTLIRYLKMARGLDRVEYAGSLRRGQESIGDIDLLATGKNSQRMMQHFFSYPKIKQILAAGETKSSVVVKSGIQVDLRVVKPESFGAALFYFTGPKHFNIHVRTIALKRGWKINEYGLYEGTKKIAGRTEEGIFKKIGLPYLTPQQRQDFNTL